MILITLGETDYGSRYEILLIKIKNDFYFENSHVARI